MRLARLRQGGVVRPAIEVAATWRDASALVQDWDAGALDPAMLAALATHDLASLPPLDSADFAPPIARIGKIIGVGLNYRAHAAECDLPLPSEPTLFLKPVSALADPISPTIMPRGGQSLDWEVELGVVIGSHGAYLTEAEALAHVAGYVLGIDFSERDFQFRRGGQGFKGKSSDSFAPLGPVLVTKSSLADPQDIRLRLSVNGALRQDGSTSDMIFSVARLVAEISQFMSLHPGDVILTGTPAGVGMGQKPPAYLSVGDVVEADGGLLGIQRHWVV
jgi:2-keto-4-pentenoate hydratase/2-oxohepta-3-ene-1,7-dioic acid hydratase in catechol pathway